MCLKGQLKTVSSSCAVLRILDVLKGTVGGGGGIFLFVVEFCIILACLKSI